MAFPAAHVTVVGATGATGIHLSDRLRERGRSVRAVSRRRETLERRFAGRDVEIAVADALDPAALERAVAGTDLVVDAIGLPPERMADHPRTAAAVAAAARAAGARCLLISSYWAFLPHRGEVVDEAHPRSGGHAWFRFRREAEDAVLAAGGAVAHLPDFFGPCVGFSTVQLALRDALAGRPVSWLGGADVPRETGYVPDLMARVAELADREEAYGTDWGLAGTGTLTARRLAELAGEHLGRRVKLRAAPRWLLAPLSRVMPSLAAARPLIAPYTRPVRYDTAKVRALLGEAAPTPFPAAVAATLDWMAAQPDVA